MLMLVVYLLIALVVSFLCSIAEAVLLSVSSGHVRMLEQSGHRSAAVLGELKSNINTPLAAILSLNTIAHTVGAAGVGAQAVAVFGSAYLSAISAALTILILVFSEIIPKSLGAHYWRQLAPVTAYFLRGLVFVLYPLVRLLELLTRRLVDDPDLDSFSRAEFTAMADLGAEEGKLAQRELNIVKNLLLLRNTRVREIMTPRTVVFSVPLDMTVQEFFREHDNVRFSRIPIFDGEPERVVAFVLRADLLLAQARGELTKQVSEFRRELHALPDFISAARAIEKCLQLRTQLVLVVDEYGGMDGILSLEDLLETLIGEEIVDEGDYVDDMQRHARRLASRKGLDT